jgi:hypothetical protein
MLLLDKGMCDGATHQCLASVSQVQRQDGVEDFANLHVLAVDSAHKLVAVGKFLHKWLSSTQIEYHRQQYFEHAQGYLYADGDGFKHHLSSSSHEITCICQP